MACTPLSECSQESMRCEKSPQRCSASFVAALVSSQFKKPGQVDLMALYPVSSARDAGSDGEASRPPTNSLELLQQPGRSAKVRGTPRTVCRHFDHGETDKSIILRDIYSLDYISPLLAAFV